MKSSKPRILQHESFLSLELISEGPVALPFPMIPPSTPEPDNNLVPEACFTPSPSSSEGSSPFNELHKRSKYRNTENLRKEDYDKLSFASSRDTKKKGH